MSSDGTLHAQKNSFRTQAVLIAAQYGGKKINVDDSHQQAILLRSPFNKLPVFESKDGTVLWDAYAIASYVGGTVAGSDSRSKAEIQQWFHAVESELYPALAGWVYPSLSVAQHNKASFDHSKERSISLLKFLDTYLLTRTYLVGERISLADIVVSLNLLLAFQHVIEPSLRKDLNNLTRWFQTLVHQPQFVSVLGSVGLCEKPAQFDAQKFKEYSALVPAHEAHVEGGKKGKDQKPKEATPKKAEKAEPKPKPAENGEEEMEDEFDEDSKKKDPFDVYPKGTFNLEDYKRFYSNNDTSKSIPYFWDKFDKENFSIWYCEYKYPQELTMVYMSCNLIAGMFQRLDKMRKNAFASMCLFGADNNSTISGIWVWRSHDLAFKLSDDWQIDYESYEWKKLDPSSAETKTLVHDYFSWEGSFGGKKFNQGKIFK